jgi:hypothetical protein
MPSLKVSVYKYPLACYILHSDIFPTQEVCCLSGPFKCTDGLLYQYLRNTYELILNKTHIQDWTYTHVLCKLCKCEAPSSNPSLTTQTIKMIHTH